MRANGAELSQRELRRKVIDLQRVAEVCGAAANKEEQKRADWLPGLDLKNPLKLLYYLVFVELDSPDTPF
jgi:hypothetical protein